MARSVARRSTEPPLPEWIRPQLTQLVDAAPDGDQWLHEIKYDGYRMHARLDCGAVKLLTRTGLDWTHKYPAIADAASSIGARQAYLDAEDRDDVEDAVQVEAETAAEGHKGFWGWGRKVLPRANR